MVSGGFGFTEGTKPAAATGVSIAYADSADHRVKAIAPDGSVSLLTNGDVDRNYVVNGGFDLAQRQVPTTLTPYTLTANRVYGFDRWGLSIQTSSLQAANVDTIATPVTGITASNYLKLKQITGAGKFILSQVVEARDGAILRGRTVRVQFKGKFSVAGAMTVRMAVIELTSAGTTDTITNPWTTAWGANSTDPTLGANLNKVAPTIITGGTLVNGAAQFVLTGTFANYGATFTTTSTAKNFIVAIWSDSQLAINDEFWITEVGMYDSETTKDWMSEPFAELMDYCLRFYEKSFPLLVVPAASVAEAANRPVYSIIGKAGATALASTIPINFMVRKRATPTVTLFTPTAAGAVPFRISGATPAAQTAVAQIGLSDVGLGVTSTGDANGAVGDRVGVHYTAESEL